MGREIINKTGKRITLGRNAKWDGVDGTRRLNGLIVIRGKVNTPVRKHHSAGYSRTENKVNGFGGTGRLNGLVTVKSSGMVTGEQRSKLGHDGARHAT